MRLRARSGAVDNDEDNDDCKGKLRGKGKANPANKATRKAKTKGKAKAGGLMGSAGQQDKEVLSSGRCGSDRQTHRRGQVRAVQHWASVRI